MTLRQDIDRPAVEIPLRDGSTALFRPVRPGDQPLLEEGFARLSMESRRARFGTGLDHLTNGELDYLANIDLVEHVAWGVIVEGEPVAVGRYVRDLELGCTEIAIAVVDEFQRRGLGRRLFEALVASAKYNGVEEMCFSVQPSNQAVLRILKRFDLGYEMQDGLMVGDFLASAIPTGKHDKVLVALLAFYQSLD